MGNKVPYVETEYFDTCLPLLKKYFGITVGYFYENLKRAKILSDYNDDGRIKSTGEESHNLELPFYHIDPNKLIELLKPYNNFPPLIEEVLFLVAYSSCERLISEEEYYAMTEDYTEDIYQSEWAHLKLFMEKLKQRDHGRIGATSITIRTNNGIKEQVSIENTDNWLFRLIEKKLSDRFPQIRTVERANADIASRKIMAGRKMDNPRYSAIAYGIYRLFHEEHIISEKPDIPNNLCELIYDYTKFVNCYPQQKSGSEEFDPKRIRADISAYKKLASYNHPPQFAPIRLPKTVICDTIIDYTLD